MVIFLFWTVFIGLEQKTKLNDIKQGSLTGCPTIPGKPYFDPALGL